MCLFSYYPAIDVAWKSILFSLSRSIGEIRQRGPISFVINMARKGTDINGVVSFHGSTFTGLRAESGDIQTRVLAIQGDGDPVAPVERQNELRDEMEAAGADFEFIIYDNVEAHNFTNPAGSSYFEAEAESAWASMLEFFDETL